MVAFGVTLLADLEAKLGDGLILGCGGRGARGGAWSCPDVGVVQRCSSPRCTSEVLLRRRTRANKEDMCSPDRLFVLRVLNISNPDLNRLWFG